MFYLANMVVCLVMVALVLGSHVHFGFKTRDFGAKKFAVEYLPTIEFIMLHIDIGTVLCTIYMFEANSIKGGVRTNIIWLWYL